jgi:hypothetical protein
MRWNDLGKEALSSSMSIHVTKLGGDWTMENSGLKQEGDVSLYGRGGNEMDFIIPKHVLNAATKCKKNLSCLRTGDTQDCCPVAKDINGLLFVKFRGSLVCGEYNLHFGGADICTCPVRRERYIRYKI